MHKTTLNSLRNTVLLMSAGLLAIGCAGKSVKPNSTAIPAPVAQTEPRDATVKADPVPPIVKTPQTVVDSAEKFPQIDITQSAQPKQRVFHFGFDQVELSEQDKAILERHAQFLLDNPQLIMQIHGHTDHHGPREYNEYLSKRRAEAVAGILLAQGVKHSQLVIDALADRQPLKDPSSSGRNRRVEIEYTEINLVSSE